MINRKVLENLSDPELEKYIKKDSRFVPEAVELAYEILKKRGREFTSIEQEQIENLIQSKKNVENKSDIKANAWDKRLTSDPNAIHLFTNRVIGTFSIVFGVFIGSCLLVYNYFKIKNYTAAVCTFVFGILYTILQIVIVDRFVTGRSGSIVYLLSGIGGLGLYCIREYIFKSDILYRPKSFIVPLILSVIVMAIMLYFAVSFADM